MDAANGHVVVTAVHVPSPRSVVGLGDVLGNVSPSMLRNGNLGPRHGSMTDVPGVVDVGLTLQALMEQFHHELFGQMGPNLLVCADENIMLVSVPTPRQVRIGLYVDEGRKDRFFAV